jgi:hypothetical protein
MLRVLIGKNWSNNNRKEMNLMIKRLVIVAGVALMVALAGLFIALPALAQGPGSWVPFGWHGGGRSFGPWGTGGWTMFDATAETLGLTPEQLFAELHAGKSPADIAEAQGVDLQTVYDAMNATRVEAMKAAIQQAVEDGRLSQEQADWLLQQGLQQGFLPRGRGFGRGFAPFPIPSVTPGSSSP